VKVRVCEEFCRKGWLRVGVDVLVRFMGLDVEIG
jgi:hypothetical protein